jgi:hypothetical protein
MCAAHAHGNLTYRYYSKRINHNAGAASNAPEPEAEPYASAGVGSQLKDRLFLDFLAGWPKLAKNDCPLVHLKGLVGHIACNLGLGLQLQQFACMNWTRDPTIDDDVIGMDVAGDGGGLTDHQNAFATFCGMNVSNHFAINANSVSKPEVTLNEGALCNQAFDGGLFFFAKHAGNPSKKPIMFPRNQS